MTKEKDIPEMPSSQPQGDWKSLLNRISYTGIVRNIPYVSFVVLLCVLYIANNQNAIETQRQLNKKNEELKELRWRYMDIKSRLMNAGMETEVIRNAIAIGLKPLEQPAYKIVRDTSNKYP